MRPYTRMATYEVLCDLKCFKPTSSLFWCARKTVKRGMFIVFRLVSAHTCNVIWRYNSCTSNEIPASLCENCLLERGCCACKTRVLWNTYPVHCCFMKLCETQLIAEEDYKFARTHTFALLTMVIALCTIKHL